MRILLAAHQTRGGIGTLVQGLSESLPAVLSPEDRLDVVNGWTNRAVRESRVGRFAFEQLALPLRARHYDLLHLPDHRPIVASRTGFLLTIHDVFFLDDPDWYPPRVAHYKRLMLRLALAKRPAALVCVSEWTKERLLARLPELRDRRVLVIPSGISQPPAPTYAPDLDRPYFLTVSTIEPRKNYLRLLDAFRRARAAGLDVTWRVVGTSGYAAEPIAAELERAQGVELCGRVGEEEKEELYAHTLFVATPSLAEGFGFPPLEAMVRGVPVACSTGSALDEVVGDAALRVDPHDVAGWSEALRSLAGNAALRSRLSDAGRRQAAEFSWERCAARYVDAYRAALGR